jgi:hypothetical protein
MAIDNEVLDYLCTKIVNTITYLTYRNPSRSNNGLSLKHVYTRVLPYLIRFKVFGYLVYVHVGKKQDGIKIYKMYLHKILRGFKGIPLLQSRGMKDDYFKGCCFQ